MKIKIRKTTEENIISVWQNGRNIQAEKIDFISRLAVLINSGKVPEVVEIDAPLSVRRDKVFNNLPVSGWKWVAWDNSEFNIKNA